MYCELVDAKITASDKDLPVTSMPISFDVADLVNWIFSERYFDPRDSSNCVFPNFSYVQYSAIAARTVRKALKDSLKADADKRDVTAIKFVKWENGKAVGKCLN